MYRRFGLSLGVRLDARFGLGWARIGIVALLLAGLLTGAPALAVGETTTSAPSAEPPREIPFGPVEAMLLRSTLIAINQANLTVDYAIVRHMLAPDLAKTYPGPQIAVLLKPWRDRRRDFGFVAIADPELDTSPTIDGQGVLRMQGSVPTPSFRLAFDLSFRKVAGRWMLSVLTLSDGTTTTSSRTVTMASARASSAESDVMPVDSVPDHPPPLPPTRPWPLSFDKK